MAAISHPHKLYHYTPAMRGRYGLMENEPIVCVRHIYSKLKEPTFKHLPQIILTTALIEAWYGAFDMHYQLGLTPHLILDLALVESWRYY
jgi:hypothetical protein